jgi:hypothetical protein
MVITPDTQQRIDVYLSRLRARLRGVHDQDVRDIVEELRSHIMDRAAAAGEITAASVDDAITALGTPEELASQYLTDNLLARAETIRSPLHILKTLSHWASLSVAGFLVFLGSIGGYSLGVGLFVCGLLKPIHPRTVGLWLLPAGPDDLEISLRLGFGTVPAGGRELLGWWMLVVGIVGGCGLVMLTTQLVLWYVRRYRRSHALLPH